MADRAKGIAPCPALCGRYHEPGEFLCSKCWRELPEYLRKAIGRTWRAVAIASGIRGDNRQYLAAVRAYREARGEALDFLANKRARDANE